MNVRVACHVHSEWSYDADWSLHDIAEVFGKRGYDAVMITEHDRGFDEDRYQAHRQACQDASTSAILIIPGIEYSDASNTIHILVWGDVPFAGENRDTLETLLHVKSHGGVAIFAHPSRKNAWRRFDAAWSRYLAGMEIWNRKTDGVAPSREGMKLCAEQGLLPFVGLDFHRRRQLCPMAMHVLVEGVMDESAILSAMRSGQVTPEAFGLRGVALEGSWAQNGFRIAESLRKTGAKAWRSVFRPSQE